jgi:hypothetical protein
LEFGWNFGAGGNSGSGNIQEIDFLSGRRGTEWSIMAWVILTSPLWEMPHRNEAVVNHYFSYSGPQFPTGFVAILYNDCSEAVRQAN